MADPFDAIVGTAHVTRPQSETLCGARVSAVVRPGSGAEVAACLRAASESAIPLVPTGGGTQLGFGNPLSEPVCVRLDLARVHAQPELDADEGVGAVDAGVTLEELAAACAALGKATVFDALRPGATVGGAIAVDGVSLEGSADRRVRNDLLGLEVALPNGELTRCGGRVVKNVTGFDLVRLYAGSFGSLGVVTRAVVRLRAAPERVAVTRARHESLADALEAMAETLLTCAIRPVSGGAEVCVRHAASAAEVEAALARAPGDPVEPEAWAGLRSELATPPAHGTVRVQLGARPSDVAILCRGLAQAAGDSALRLVLPRSGMLLGRADASAVPARFALAERTGAALWLERAPGESLPCDAFGPPPPALPWMRALKTRFDPQRVLSPGRFVGGI